MTHNHKSKKLNIKVCFINNTHSFILNKKITHCIHDQKILTLHTQKASAASDFSTGGLLRDFMKSAID